jgi:hypothetical protein
MRWKIGGLVIATRCPCTKKHAIGADLHSTEIVDNLKLLELKNGFSILVSHRGAEKRNDLRKVTEIRSTPFYFCGKICEFGIVLLISGKTK